MLLSISLASMNIVPKLVDFISLRCRASSASQVAA